MKIQYFPATDTLSIELSDSPAADTRLITDNITLDLDAQGQPVALDIDQASKYINLTTLDLSKIPFPVHQTI